MKCVHSCLLGGVELALLTANDMAITSQGDWEEVDDIEALSFKRH